ncbi:MAG: MerR family transcriptional regulator [Actinobacteria bacterium]|nr:MerR family transcriptional regulator [Actinomycetota bacterium]
MAGYMRIGELSRRTGIAPELLRAWERRYALLEPSRSNGGYRLYSEADLLRLRAMQSHLASGLSAAEAAALALAGPAPSVPKQNGSAQLADLREALDRFDDAMAHAVVDRALASLTVDAVLTELILPYLAELGSRWERGEASIAQEHFASNVLRGRLLGLARGWDGGAGPRAVLACVPGELHDLPLIAFGLALRARGWRITYLGADTPIATAAGIARELPADAFVLSATAPERLAACSAELGSVADDVPLALAGAGATPALAARLGAQHLSRDPVSEAERLTRETRPRA